MTPSPVFSSGESHRGESHKGGRQAIVHGVEKAGHNTHTHTHQTQRTFIETTFL